MVCKAWTKGIPIFRMLGQKSRIPFKLDEVKEACMTTFRIGSYAKKLLLS
jgi:hypothetical protein